MSYAKEVLETHLRYLIEDIETKVLNIEHYEGYLVTLKTQLSELKAAEIEIISTLKGYENV